MAKSHLLERFLSASKSVHNTRGGIKETSYYTAINNLLDGVGHTLKPKVRCVMQLKNLGAGNPDGGLFTADQFDRHTGEAKDLGKPSRGVIEVKSPAEPVDDTATTGQITKYWDRYKLVLVTNLRDWLLLGEREGNLIDGMEKVTPSRRLQQKIHMHRVIRKLDFPVRRLVQHPAGQQGLHITMHGFHIAPNPAGGFADGDGTGACQGLNQVEAFAAQCAHE